ncbi:MAG: YqgE/AlgH family protein [Lysobacterales bacterium]|jgi:putative transcriptional regulator|nr:MAG: YqgE/AlgH family protein [Xanthomonadales bacterium]
MSGSYLENQFLIAMPGMGDPNFAQTVTLVCEHNAQGALGIVINRPLGMTLADVFGQLGLDATHSRVAGDPVLQGGPVQTERGFVLHAAGTPWDSTISVSERLQLTTSRDVLDALARGEGPEAVLFALGYAGWGAGQLEAEMAQNAWLTVPADEALLFRTPPQDRWHAAGRLLGVNLLHLSSDAGHA